MSHLLPEKINNHVSIDLVICTYNNAALLDRALTAISQQQVPHTVNWTVLVVNNNCTDNTTEVVDKHIKSEKIPDLSIISEPKQGLNYARICGVNNTSGDWIAFVDDDCMLKEDWVAQAAKFAQLHPECGAFGGQVILDWETPPPAFVLKYGYSFAQQEHGTNISQPNCLVGAGLVISRKAILDTNWLHKQFLSDRVGKQLISGGDVEIVLRIKSAGYDIWYNPACKLMHFIPAKRTEEKYLVNINYALGKCQLMSDSMVWSNSYLSYFFESIFSTLDSSLDVFKQALKFALGRGYLEFVDIAITWAFVRGKWAGIAQMLSMEIQQRQALLGCAKLAQKNTFHKAPLERFLAQNPFPEPLTQGFFYREKMRAIHYIAPQEPLQAILEVGGGQSGLTALLYPEAQITNLDLNSQYAQAPCNQQERVCFVHGDATALPFENNSFDAVTMFDLLEHVPEDKKAATEALRVLRPGGFLLISTPNENWRFPYYNFMNFICPSEAEIMAEWGHVRRGYTLAELQVLIGLPCQEYATFINPLTVLGHDVAFSSLSHRKRQVLCKVLSPLTWLSYYLHQPHSRGTETASVWQKDE